MPPTVVARSTSVTSIAFSLIDRPSSNHADRPGVRLLAAVDVLDAVQPRGRPGQSGAATGGAALHRLADAHRRAGGRAHAALAAVRAAGPRARRPAGPAPDSARR